MSYELQAAYQESMATYNYNPDGERIMALARAGLYVVISESTAYCPITDASLPTPRRTLVITDWETKKAAVFQTQQRAEAYVAALYENEDGDREQEYRILAPVFYDADTWLRNVVDWVSEIGNLDRENAFEWIAGRREELLARFPEKIDPALFAAQFLRDHSEMLDYDAWAKEQMLDRPVEMERPEPSSWEARYETPYTQLQRVRVERELTDADFPF